MAAVQVGSQCYATSDVAMQAIAADIAGGVHSTAAGLYGVDVTSTTGSSYTIAFTPLDGGPALPAVVVPVTLQPCNLLEAEDAVSIGWLLIGAWVSVYAVRFVARSLRGVLGGTESDA